MEEKIDNSTIRNDGVPNYELCPHQNITKEKIKSLLPKKSGAVITQAIVDEISRVEQDTNLNQDYFEERFLGNLHLLSGSGVSIEKYVNALKYVELSQHYKNKQAWSIVFPEKYARLEAEGRVIDTHVSAFENSKLVVEMKKEMMIPAYITYQKLNHQSIMKQVNLMNGKGANDDDKVSAHVQHLAAKELYEMTKMPEDNTIELKIGATDAMVEQQAELNANIASIVAMQKKAFESGGAAIDVQKIHYNSGE